MGSVGQTESEMRLSRLSVLLLLSSCWMCEGRVRSPGPGGCTTTCCMSCELGDNCEICYKLNPPGSLYCPCLDSLTGPQLSRFSPASGRGDLSGGDCVPSCCPSMLCTESSCPLCYRRHRADPAKCPCRPW